MHANGDEGLPAEIQKPVGAPIHDLGQAPDRAHFLYGISWLSMGVSIAGGSIAAILRWGQFAEETLMLFLAIMSGLASVVAFVVGMLAYYDRKNVREQEWIKRQREEAWHIEELERVQVETRKQIEQEYVNMMARADEIVRRSWTPAIVTQHVNIDLTTVSLFEADVHLGKPALLLEWKITSVARVPCDVIVDGGTCTFSTLPFPGKSICTRPLTRFDTSFDGALAPGTITYRKKQWLHFDVETVGVLREAFRDVIAAAVTIHVDGYSIKLEDKIYSGLTLDSIQKIIDIPAWLREQTNEHRA